MDSNESRARALLGDLSAGCSAVAWETADGGHLWGRNFDFNRIAADSKVTFVPRGQVFYACGTELEGNLEPSTRCTAAYAAVGIGSLVLRSTPALYEGLNEKGLMGGQLYYRTFAHFAPEARPGTLPLQPPFLVTWCLATCASVEEVARALEERVSLVAIPMLVGLTLCLVQFGLGPVGVYWIYAANIAALVLALWVRRRPPLLSDRDVYFDGEH